VIAAAQPGRPQRPLPPPAPCTGGPTDPCAPLRLADGRTLRVLPLGPADAAAEQAFIEGLSQNSRYRRFHAGLPGVPPAVLQRLVDVDQQAHVALAARIGTAGPIVADARYVRDAAGGGDGQGAEFALTVADPWQGRGIGRKLLMRLACHAHGQGIGLLHGAVMWDNRPMIGLVEALGGHVVAPRHDPGVLQARLRTALLLQDGRS
jgi:acetyltransferase